MEKVPTPQQVAARLQQIAKSLRDSENPDPNRVASALQEIISRIAWFPAQMPKDEPKSILDRDALIGTLERALKAGVLVDEEVEPMKAALEALKAEKKAEEEKKAEPKQAASALRNIAARIDASKAPDPKLVARDIRRVIASLEK